MSDIGLHFCYYFINKQIAFAGKTASFDIKSLSCLTGKSAVQRALAVSRQRQKSPDGVGEAFEYTVLFDNRWAKDDKTWKLAATRMDIMDWAGDHDAFSLPFQDDLR